MDAGDIEDVGARIDHTVLGPGTTPEDVSKGVAAASEYGMNFATYPSHIPAIREQAPGLAVVAPVGFPHGQHATETKAEEARLAVAAGADEVDVSANVGLVRAGREADAREDLAAVVDAADVPLKVIIESPLLDEGEIRLACRAARDAGADFVKTSSGFVEGGATVADVSLMAEYLPVKASGGVGSWAEAKAMFEAGAERVGASSGVEIVEGYRAARE
jgi:deoxyribose-phosphate aldolase